MEERPSRPMGGTLEVPERPKRRRFSADYKLQVLEEAEKCTEPGQVGALLRREGLYSSHLTSWRRQRDEGALSGLNGSRRGRRRGMSKAKHKELEKLRRENKRLKDELRKAELVIDVQKKVSELLGLQSEPPPTGKSSS